MPLSEAMETQRAIRRLKPDPVDDAIILRCIELALKAPTGSNAQNWEWIVVRDPEVKARLARLYRQAWSVYGWLGRRISRGDEKMGRVIGAVQWQVDHFEEVPRAGRRVPARPRQAPGPHPGGGQLPLRLDLSGDPELPAGVPGGGIGRRADHPPEAGAKGRSLRPVGQQGPDRSA
jgi:nitroreductase